MLSLRVCSVFATFVSIASGSPASTSIDSIEATSSTIIQFPKGTWNENIAQTSSGGILLTQLSPSPALVYVANPASASPTYSTIESFPSPATAATGIGQLGTDVFYVGTFNHSFSSFTAVPNTTELWKVDLSKSDTNPTVTLVASLPQIEFLNGVTGVPGTTKVLIADSTGGVVYRVDVNSGASDVALNNSAVNTPSGAISGVNGVHAPGDGFLYFSNSGTSSFNKVAIDSTSALPTGVSQQLWKNTTISPDDFVLLSQQPSAYAGGAIALVADSANNRVVAIDGTGRNNYTTVANINGPTSGVLASQNVVYIASTGGDQAYAQNPVTVGGALTEIKLG